MISSPLGKLEFVIIDLSGLLCAERGKLLKTKN